MRDQRLCHVPGAGLIAHCPDIGGAGARDALQDVVLRAGIRAGHELPLAAVPVLDQGALHAIGTLILPDRPRVSGRERRHGGGPPPPAETRAPRLGQPPLHLPRPRPSPGPHSPPPPPPPPP